MTARHGLVQVVGSLTETSQFTVSGPTRVKRSTRRKFSAAFWKLLFEE